MDVSAGAVTEAPTVVVKVSLMSKTDSKNLFLS